MADLFKQAKAELLEDQQRERFLENRRKRMGKTGKRWTQSDYNDSLRSYSDSELDWTFGVTRRTLVCPAFLALSNGAVRLYLGCLVQTYYLTDRPRRNQGRTWETELEARDFTLTYGFCKAYGIKSSSSVKSCISELLDFGFITISRPGTRNKPTWYSHSAEYLKHSQFKVNEILKTRSKKKHSISKKRTSKANSISKNRTSNVKAA